MGFKLGTRSLKNLEGVHPDLKKVMMEAIEDSPIDFMILEGLRTLSRQQELVRMGASKTMNSRHLTGHAVDIAPLLNGVIRFDWPLYYRLAPVIKDVAVSLKVSIVWGGDWRTFKDGPHFELDRKKYP